MMGPLPHFIKYHNLNEGKAININISPGVIVQLHYIKVPCFIYARIEDWKGIKRLWIVAVS